jgi:hypothetical protein
MDYDPQAVLFGPILLISCVLWDFLLLDIMIATFGCVYERSRTERYDYICTHVDDFKIVAKDPERWKSLISADLCGVHAQVHRSSILLLG